MEGITLYHVSNGKLAEMWDRYDNLALMQQLGPTSETELPSPARALDRGFAGACGDLSRTRI